MSETNTQTGTRTGSLADLKDLAVSAGVAVTQEEAIVRQPKRDAQGRSYATGRRKNAVARVWIKPGKGEITVNNRKVGTYFARPVLRMLLAQPFLVADRYNQFDVYCTVNGGGLSGQAGALRHGISRALTYYEPTLRGILKSAGFLTRDSRVVADRYNQFDVYCTVNGGGLSGQAGALRHGISRALTYYEPTLRGILKSAGFLTRDSRVVERKKYGKAKARRSFQFSKR